MVSIPFRKKKLSLEDEIGEVQQRRRILIENIAREQRKYPHHNVGKIGDWNQKLNDLGAELNNLYAQRPVKPVTPLTPAEQAQLEAEAELRHDKSVAKLPGEAESTQAMVASPTTPLTDLERRKLELELEKLELEKQVAQKQLAQGGGGGDGGGGGTPGGGGAPTGGGSIKIAGMSEKAGKELRREAAESPESLKELKEGLKLGTKKGGLPYLIALIPAAAIVGVSYFVLNNWITLGVNLLPVPIGPLLNQLWWVAYVAIFLLSWAILAQNKSPGTILASGLLIAFLIWLVFGVLVGIFTDFLGPFVGPGLTCALEITKAQQQGGAIPPECLGQSTTQVQKTGIVNLLSVSFGQSGVPFPQPTQGQQYQFPITITNPSQFDIGPVVLGNAPGTPGGYICGKSQGYNVCGVPGSVPFKYNYTMTGTSCTSDSDNCIIGTGGSPLILSLQGGSIPFPASYVSIFVNVKYPFNTSGTNDYYIVKTFSDVPKSISSCTGSGTRPLGEACTGAGPINVIPSFSENPFYLSLIELQTKGHNVTLTITVSNIGDGTAILHSINVTQFTSSILDRGYILQGGLIINGTNNCNLLGDTTGNNFADTILGGTNPQGANYGSVFKDVGLPPIGETSTNAFIIHSQEAATFICRYHISPNVQLTGPSLDVKAESRVWYDYYKTPSKTDVLVKSLPSAT